MTAAMAAHQSNRLPAAVCNTTLLAFISGPMSGQQPSIQQNQRVVDFRGKRKKQGDCSASPSFGTMSVPGLLKRSSTLVSSLPQRCRGHHTSTAFLHRVTHKVFILRRLAYRCRDNNFVCSLYLALVRPVLEYAGPVWDSCNKADSLRLERVQLSIARSILRADRRSTGNISVLESIGWPTLSWRRRRFKLLLLWKLLNGEGPPSLFAKVPPLVECRGMQMLRRRTIEVPLCRTERRLRSFCPQLLSYGTPSLSISHPLLPALLFSLPLTLFFLKINILSD